MKKLLTILAIGAIFLSGCSDKTKSAKSKFIKDAVSQYKIDKTIELIQNTLKSKNYKLISVYDHEKEAIKLKEMLYPAKTIELENSKISTTLIQCNPSMALELPIRVAVYNELNGKTHISFTDPEYWSLKHNIKDKKCISLILLLKQDLLEIYDKVAVKEK